MTPAMGPVVTVPGSPIKPTEAGEYRIEFQIQRRLDGEDDFTEIGFASSGAWGSVEQACHIVGSLIDNGNWETEPGYPDPSDVIRSGP